MVNPSKKHEISNAIFLSYCNRHREKNHHKITRENTTTTNHNTLQTSLIFFRSGILVAGPYPQFKPTTAAPACSRSVMACAMSTLSAVTLPVEGDIVITAGKPKYSIICIQRPLKGSNKSGLLQQVVFKCRLY